MFEVVALPFDYGTWALNVFVGFFSCNGCFLPPLAWNFFVVGQYLLSDGAWQTVELFGWHVR